MGTESVSEGISRDLRANVDMLGEALGDAIERLLGESIFETVEELRSACIAIAREGRHELEDEVWQTIEALDDSEITSVIRSFTAYFRLVNEAEKVEIERVNRERSKDSPATRPGSIASSVAELAAGGCTLEEVRDVIESLDIQPTLTAHPTEARRRTTVELERSIGEVLRKEMIEDTTADERADLVRQMRSIVEMLLATEEIPPQRRSVRDEVQLGLHFLSTSIWEVVPRIHRDLRNAVERHFGESVDLAGFLHHRTWIGGDRDGNPNVTPEITRWVFEEQRTLAVELHRSALLELREQLSASERIVEFPEELLDSLERDDERNPLSDDVNERYRNEPFRRKLTHMLRKLDEAVSGTYSAEEFCDELELIHRTVVDVFGACQVEGDVRDALVRARTFGFHLSTVDFRQHAAEHARAVAELLAVNDLSSDYLDLDESDRQRVLVEALKSDVLSPLEDPSDKSDSLMKTFEVAREAIEVDGRSVRSWVISMTHAPSAVLEVLVLARTVGLWRLEDGRVECPLHVVPLVETVDDLRGADELLDALFSIDVYRAHLRACGDFQEVMLGYSDSNKDGGFWAANAALYDGQKRISRVCDEHGLSHRLFHGRGGTVGRGGGRANRAIFALPPATRNGRIRFTEQGEVISFRYANAALSHRHLEQVTSAMMLTVANPNSNQPPESAEEALTQLVEASREAYRDLIEDNEFWPWYRSATPIEHISRLPIASRPASRSKGELEFNDLRAIPWNFAWTQTRYCVPGWFGLQVLDSTEELAELYDDWDFLRTVVENCELEMARVRLPAAKYYDSLAENSLHGQLASAFETSRDLLLRIKGEDTLLARNQVIKESIELRNPYTDVLNMLQVELLKRHRESQGERRDRLEESILLSLNGVAAAMQSTG